MYTTTWKNHPNLGWCGNNNIASKPNNFQPQQPRSPP